MIVSIFTDASYDVKTGVAAYAFVAKYKDKCHYEADKIKIPIQDSHHAELYAIFRALYHCVYHYDCRTIFIKTDSQPSIQRIERSELNKSGIYLKTLGHIKQLRKSNNLILRFKHVKAHTEKQDANSLINSWCDRAAGLANGRPESTN